MPRPRTPLLSTERIADAAMELVDDGEPFGVNAIARRLGVTPSSLYSHVAGRDEIVELMRARMADRYTPPLDGTWDDVVERMLRAQRRMKIGSGSIRQSRSSQFSIFTIDPMRLRRTLEA